MEYQQQQQKYGSAVEAAASRRTIVLPGSWTRVLPSSSINVGEVLAELERTKKKNTELQGIVSSLEAILTKGERYRCTLSSGSKKSNKQRKVEKS
ncbi:hypothetical protein R1flu_018644 [Riccia fluitans]|uniref:Uncharacterized protein n=1 Tax=Riccia fluitans TaxID=41844 RepID=A0ABD1ZHY4_9MARC